MGKKNLPNIPVYIGDWERDCNVLSLEAEAAWMKIIFKMHLAGKQSTYKTSTKGLQILWKSSPEKVQEIISELKFNDIGGISEIDGGYVFLCRRIAKENHLSEVRSEARKSGHDKIKTSTKPLQNDYKSLQNTDIDIENEKGKGVVGEKPIPDDETVKEFQECIEAAKPVAEFFNVNMVHGTKQINRIASFILYHRRNGTEDDFWGQFKAYTEYKTKADETIHGLDNYLGDPPDFNGEWAQKDYVAKLRKLSKGPSETVIPKTKVSEHSKNLLQSRKLNDTGITKSA